MRKIESQRTPQDSPVFIHSVSKRREGASEKVAADGTSQDRQSFLSRRPWFAQSVPIPKDWPCKNRVGCPPPLESSPGDGPTRHLSEQEAMNG